MVQEDKLPLVLLSRRFLLVPNVARQMAMARRMVALLLLLDLHQLAATAVLKLPILLHQQPVQPLVHLPLVATAHNRQPKVSQDLVSHNLVSQPRSRTHFPSSN